MTGYEEFATWCLLVVILLGVQTQIVKLQKRINKLESEPKK